MNYIGLNYYDTANGDGIRVSLFVSGCSLRCPGCFNKESWDFNAGKPFTKDIKRSIIRTLKKPYISGISILGGEPFEPENTLVLVPLCAEIRKKFKGKTIWIWTGHSYKEIKDTALAQYCDVIVDGPFIQRLASADIKFRGSTNQQIIKVKNI